MSGVPSMKLISWLRLRGGSSWGNGVLRMGPFPPVRSDTLLMVL